MIWHRYRQMVSKMMGGGSGRCPFTLLQVHPTWGALDQILPDRGWAQYEVLVTLSVMTNNIGVRINSSTFQDGYEDLLSSQNQRRWPAPLTIGRFSAQMMGKSDPCNQSPDDFTSNLPSPIWWVVILLLQANCPRGIWILGTGLFDTTDGIPGMAHGGSRPVGPNDTVVRASLAQCTSRARVRETTPCGKPPTYLGPEITGEAPTTLREVHAGTTPHGARITPKSNPRAGWTHTAETTRPASGT